MGMRVNAPQTMQLWAGVWGWGGGQRFQNQAQGRLLAQGKRQRSRQQARSAHKCKMHGCKMHGNKQETKAAHSTPWRSASSTPASGWVAGT